MGWGGFSYGKNVCSGFFGHRKCNIGDHLNLLLQTELNHVLVKCN